MTSGDNPIRNSDEDVLGRAALAKNFALSVASLDASEGAVVGVLGAWGSGKTSFVNLARGAFASLGMVVLDFNPWMFSGTEQLVEMFFVELSAQLKAQPKFVRIGRFLDEYGEAFSELGWLPVVGTWVERARAAARILARLLRGRSQGIESRRMALRRALAGLGTPIAVVLDDIDRLSSSEIRDVFKLVRLTACFPNLIYLLAFDRVRVEQALSESGVPGRDYLEKILQVAVDLPSIPTELLTQQVANGLYRVLSGIDHPGPFQKQAWPDILFEIVRPLIRNMRDVRRYELAVGGTIRALNGEVALCDVLALEAVRLFLPDLFGCLRGAVDGLTTTGSGGVHGGGGEEVLKLQIDGFLAAGGKHESVARAVIGRLFPAAQRHVGGSHYGSDWQNTWLKERRVAHADILRRYLEGVAGENLRAFADAEQAWSLLDDREALNTYMHTIEITRVQDVIAALENFQDDFGQEHVVPGSVVLLNLLHELPEKQRDMFALDTSMVVGRVVYRLLKCLGQEALVEHAVREILPDVGSLSSRLELINIVGHRDNLGHKLVSAAVAEALEREWRRDVRVASAAELAGEKDLLRLLYRASREADASEGRLVIEDSVPVTLAVLQSALVESLGRSLGSRAIRRSPRLAWDPLVEIYGDEATLRERIEKLRAAALPNVGDLLELADMYLAGWRPSD